MSQEPRKPLENGEIVGIKPQYFADLIRTAQLIFDPCAGVSGRNINIDWEDFDIPANVVDNLMIIGQEFQYASPNLPIDVIWSKLTPETRIWFIENKEKLWQFEEIFPALDED